MLNKKNGSKKDNKVQSYYRNAMLCIPILSIRRFNKLTKVSMKYFHFSTIHLKAYKSTRYSLIDLSKLHHLSDLYKKNHKNKGL
jgi:hypothetical protein